MALTKLEKLKKAVDKINDKAGSQALTVGSELEEFEILETPFVSLNKIVKGFPRGRFTTVAGPEHVGKGALLAQVIAHHQQQDPEFIALWTDAETSLDTAWLARLGVDLDRLIVQTYTRETNTMEKLLQQTLDMIEAGIEFDMWVVDSIGALLPQGDAKKDLEGTNMLNLQRKLGEFYRKANVVIKPSGSYKGTAVILVGQVYTVPDAKISLQEVKGGNAVKHWAHVRITMRRGPKSDWPEKVDLIGPDGVKRKYYPGWAGIIKLENTRQTEHEGKQVVLNFLLGSGFDSVDSVIHAAFGLGLIERRGPNYMHSSFPDGKLKGKDAVFEFLRTNDEARKAIQLEILAQSDVPEDLKSSEDISDDAPSTEPELI